jgi:hypothetical protein
MGELRTTDQKVRGSSPFGRASSAPSLNSSDTVGKIESGGAGLVFVHYWRPYPARATSLKLTLKELMGIGRGSPIGRGGPCNQMGAPVRLANASSPRTPDMRRGRALYLSW